MFQEQRSEQLGEYERLQNMPLRELLQSQRNNSYNLEANRRTKTDLLELGFTFEARQLNLPDVQSGNQEYLVIKPK